MDQEIEIRKENKPQMMYGKMAKRIPR